MLSFLISIKWCYLENKKRFRKKIMVMPEQHGVAVPKLRSVVEVLLVLPNRHGKKLGQCRLQAGRTPSSGWVN